MRRNALAATIDGKSEIQVRPNAFARLLANVVGNAFRYARNVSIRAVHRGGTLTVTVDDDGPGIPAEKREDIFKPFVRLDAARNQDDSGTGLGLAIARDIARSHGGDITLEDSPMGGLRAVVKVPPPEGSCTAFILLSSKDAQSPAFLKDAAASALRGQEGGGRCAF